jgi:ribosomal protein S18 acetylase RimI-like enzyme
MVKIEILTGIDQGGADRLNELMSQLCPDCPAHPLTHFRDILYHPTTRLIVATDGEKITGCLTLVWYKIPSLTRFWIEDVVVDHPYRGLGIGKTMILKAIELVQALGGRYIDLTSRPSRIEANHLYQSLGFEKRETNVYRFRLNASSK